MKLQWITPLALAALTTSMHAEGNLELKDARDKASYAIGQTMGNDLLDRSVSLVKEVIKGWTEVLPLIKVGSKWQVFVPAELAYGEKGAGLKIGPNQTLIFEIELLSIES
jgi:hypothetical protein